MPANKAGVLLALRAEEQKILKSVLEFAAELGPIDADHLPPPAKLDELRAEVQPIADRLAALRPLLGGGGAS